MEYGLVALWLAMYLIVGLATLPLAAALFPRFQDAGAAFAIPVGLGTIGIVGYLVGHLAFGWPALLAALVVLLAASAFAGDNELVDEYAYAEVAVVFAVAFGFLVAIRSVTPEIAPLPLAIGEKFLDFGLLRTSLRAEALPPEDMWFAGESLQYYYGGQMLTALLTILTGTAPRFAYNLALAGFYASLVTAAYGLAGAIADSHGAPRRIAAGLGAFFVGIAGNLYTAGQVLVWLLPDSLVASVTGFERGGEILSWNPTEFWFFDTSRIIPGTINEFPLFAWLNGDLHAHMLTTPFTLLVAALCFSYWQTPEPERTRRRLLLASTAPVAGFLAISNTWDFPIAAGVVLLTVAFAPSDPATLLPPRLAERVPPREGLLEEVRRDGLALAGAVAVLLVGGLLVIPFWFGTASTRSLGFLPPRSDLGPLLIVHGGFLLAFVPYLAGRVYGTVTVPRKRLAAAAVIGAVLLVAVWLSGFAAVALFGPLLVAAWYLLRRRADVGFEAVLLLAGIGLVLIVEFAYVIEPQYQGTDLERMNTVFKTYMQVWVLWAPAAGVALARLVDPSNALPSVDTPAWRSAGVAIACAVLLTTGLYAGFAVPAHFGNQPVGSDGPTLDGTAYTYERYPDEAAAIDWLDAREGQPTIVTAAPGGYRWNPDEGQGASAPASLTGVPTVLGWFHERQYRGGEPYEKRLSDVETIYEGSTVEQSSLFERYDVEYVYVGPAERARYDLAIEDHPDLAVAFWEGDVVIYEVQG
ncbi:hypothetical protein HWV23_13165 [Natronomonas halophila]|uniref:DUF2298 domain-containing protein n=1 Tax=Natronomonas halophila TaxID=2747817 RepID=UPI0015B48BE2|nr:DUF2298 domain-containing protein [Natronomonas halophila]QLD86635.1 hypothetical protein HWV23_13165 [Natronomonas halophila]